MTITPAYTQALTADAGLGGTDYRYAVTVPVSVSGEAFRVTLQGPASGSSYFSDVWALGHGQIKVGGNASFTVGAGQSVTSDAIASPPSGTLTLVFDLSGSSTYRRKSAPGMSYAYKAGQGNAGNQSPDLGTFTTIPNFTAAVSGVEVGDVADFGSSPPPPIEEGEDETGGGVDAILADQVYASGNYFAGVPGQKLHLALFNPTASPVNAFLRSIVIIPDADTTVSLTAVEPPSPAWPVNGSHCNARFAPGAPSSKAKLRYSSSASVLGGQHEIDVVFAGRRNKLSLGWAPMAMTAPGYTGICLVFHSTGVGATVTFHWQELPV